MISRTQTCGDGEASLVNPHLTTSEGGRTSVLAEMAMALSASHQRQVCLLCGGHFRCECSWPVSLGTAQDSSGAMKGPPGFQETRWYSTMVPTGCQGVQLCPATTPLPTSYRGSPAITHTSAWQASTHRAWHPGMLQGVS